MTFVHENAEFPDLLRIVSARRRLGLGLIEKDYWVTHTLWALHQSGFENWFKGGTSLSKGFGLIERFSEDLDLKIESGGVQLPDPGNWKSDGTLAVQRRREYFDALGGAIRVPGASVAREAASQDRPDPTHREGKFRINYPGLHLAELTPPMRPYVLLEVGNARVTPFVERGMTSFVHEYLEEIGQLDDFEDNRPRDVRCAHPLVTLLEKIDALQRRALREDVEPATFVRHYEDAARIIAHAAELPPLEGYENPRALAVEMHSQRQIARLPVTEDDAFRVLENLVGWRSGAPTLRSRICSGVRGSESTMRANGSARGSVRRSGKAEAMPDKGKAPRLITVRPSTYWRALEDLNLWPSDS